MRSSGKKAHAAGTGGRATTSSCVALSPKGREQEARRKTNDTALAGENPKVFIPR
jgi:hypothetical protein